MAKTGINWTGPLSANLLNLDAKIRSRIGRAAGAVAPRIEADMKRSAPWTDRTSNARNSLSAVAKGGTDSITITLSGGVSYQIWLETRWSGKYAILKPSLLKWGPRVMEQIGKAVFNA